MTRILPAPVAGLALILTVLAACNAPVGARGASGVPAFGEYQQQLRARERGIPYSVPPETGAPLVAPGAAMAPALAAPLAPATQLPATPLSVTPVVPVGTQPLPPAAPAPADATARPAGVDANTFTPIPFGQRPQGAEIPPQGTTEIVTVANVPTGAAGGPNVVDYALSTTHAVGTERHSRRNPFRWMRWESSCLGFVNQDAAQEAFLAAGGPERDRQNLDPDGDGFACWWDPQVYRRAAAIPATVAGEATPEPATTN